MGYLYLDDYVDMSIEESQVIGDISNEALIKECYVRANRDFLIDLLKEVLVIEDDKAKEIIRTYTLK